MYDLFGWLLIIAYVIAGYWATGQTIFYNKIVMHKTGYLFGTRLVGAVFLGWLLIPIALVLSLIRKR